MRASRKRAANKPLDLTPGLSGAIKVALLISALSTFLQWHFSVTFVESVGVPPR